jgi:hypothetical protein
MGKIWDGTGKTWDDQGNIRESFGMDLGGLFQGPGQQRKLLGFFRDSLGQYPGLKWEGFGTESIDLKLRSREGFGKEMGLGGKIAPVIPAYAGHSLSLIYSGALARCCALDLPRFGKNHQSEVVMSTKEAARESHKKYPDVLVFKVSKDQRDKIRADAQAAGKSVCAYIRDKITGKRVQAITDAQMLSELRRIGAGIIHFKISNAEAVERLEKLRLEIERRKAAIEQ